MFGFVGVQGLSRGEVHGVRPVPFQLGDVIPFPRDKDKIYWDVCSFTWRCEEGLLEVSQVGSTRGTEGQGWDGRTTRICIQNGELGK